MITITIGNFEIKDKAEKSTEKDRSITKETKKYLGMNKFYKNFDSWSQETLGRALISARYLFRQGNGH